MSVEEEDWLERLLQAFPKGLPTTQRFSRFARDAASDCNPLSDPDAALLTWMDLEERMFLTYEKHIVSERLREGFVSDGVADVDAFIKYSLSVQNRRKSRAGFALGHHVEALLKVHGVRHIREATTEKRNGPDFLFPSEAEYHNLAWSTDNLLMLGVKTSCKDRWRQVLAEADRIPRKHLLTLEPGISPAQTDEMKKENLCLVIPAELHASYRPAQQIDLASVSGFIELAKTISSSGSQGINAADRLL